MRYKHKELIEDFTKIIKKTREEGYFITSQDIFALGYLAAKYDLTRFTENQEAVIKACAEYDKTDDLCLYDTIAETLIDLDVIKNDGTV